MYEVPQGEYIALESRRPDVRKPTLWAVIGRISYIGKSIGEVRAKWNEKLNLDWTKPMLFSDF